MPFYTIESDTNAYDASENYSTYVLPDGSTLVASNPALSLSGYSVTALIEGRVEAASGSGVEVTNYNVNLVVEKTGEIEGAVYGVGVVNVDGFTLDNAGTISSATVYGVYVDEDSTGVHLVNSGRIEGNTHAIYTEADASSLINDGLLVSYGTGSAAVALIRSGAQKTFVNNGTVRGDIGVEMLSDLGILVNYGKVVGQSFAFKSAFGPGEIHNYGKLVGDVDLGSGADQVFFHKGAKHKGAVYASNGKDTLIGNERGDRFFGENDEDTLLGRGGDDVLDSGDDTDLVHGGRGDDVIEGGDGVDELHGGKGDDTITDSAGDNDLIYGGDGDDHITGGADVDQIWGDEGDDKIFGNGGDDTLRGGEGNDKIVSTDGSAMSYGEDGNDVLVDGDGAASLDGGEGNDKLKGGGGNDQLKGGGGNDRLLGGDGHDRLEGGAGKDILTGGEGVDVFDFQNEATGNDVITDFEDGVDYIDLTAFDLNNTASGFADAQDFYDRAVSFKSNGDAVIDLGLTNDGRGTISVKNASFLTLDDFIF